jgi:hypothetical protein
VYWDIFHDLDRGLKQILREHTRRGQFATRPKPSEGIDCFIDSSEDLMKLETIKIFF